MKRPDNQRSHRLKTSAAKITIAVNVTTIPPISIPLPHQLLQSSRATISKSDRVSNCLGTQRPSTHCNRAPTKNMCHRPMYIYHPLCPHWPTFQMYQHQAEQMNVEPKRSVSTTGSGRT